MRERRRTRPQSSANNSERCARSASTSRSDLTYALFFNLMDPPFQRPRRTVLIRGPTDPIEKIRNRSDCLPDTGLHQHDTHQSQRLAHGSPFVGQRDRLWNPAASSRRFQRLARSPETTATLLNEYRYLLTRGDAQLSELYFPTSPTRRPTTARIRRRHIDRLLTTRIRRLNDALDRLVLPLTDSAGLRAEVRNTLNTINLLAGHSPRLTEPLRQLGESSNFTFDRRVWDSFIAVSRVRRLLFSVASSLLEGKPQLSNESARHPTFEELVAIEKPPPPPSRQTLLEAYGLGDGPSMSELASALHLASDRRPRPSAAPIPKTSTTPQKVRTSARVGIPIWHRLSESDPIAVNLWDPSLPAFSRALQSLRDSLETFLAVEQVGCREEQITEIERLAEPTTYFRKHAAEMYFGDDHNLRYHPITLLHFETLYPLVSTWLPDGLR